MDIKRDKYLNDLIERMHNGMIKIVTGIRRVGKSYLLFKIFKQYLLTSGVPEDHLIEINLDDRANIELRDPDKFYKFVRSKITDGGQFYVLIDEVQFLPDFEDVLNGFMHIDNLDTYVTGSNSRFLSKDVVTEFRGRGDEIHIYPLTFKEYYAYSGRDVYRAWADYIVYGGLPYVVTLKSEERKAGYLSNLFKTTYLKDIIERNHIEKTQELEDLINVLASSVGSLSNPSKIKATMESELRSKISLNTIKSYIDYLEEAFVLNAAYRYDIKGRRYIGAPLKYYFEDVGLRNARLGFRQVEETHLMENIIFNELLFRGFSVDVGVVNTRELNPEGNQQRKQLEIDFVANKGNRKFYLQSAFSLLDENKIRQEEASLINVEDSFKKIIVVKDIINIQRDEDGINKISVFDFLLDENSLNL